MDARYFVDIDSNIITCFLEGILTPKSYEIVSTAIASQPILSAVNKTEVLAWSSDRGNNQTNTDSISVAATAIAHNLILLIRNEKDFKGISSLRWINPF
jgi:hypothetical protein